MITELLEILVPCQYNTGRPVRTAHHKEWDKFVKSLTGGLTILKPAKGVWVNNNKEYNERVIPVRIACTEENINKIADFTASHYKQLAIMFYKISNEAHIKSYNSTKPNQYTIHYDNILDEYLVLGPEGTRKYTFNGVESLEDIYFCLSERGIKKEDVRLADYL